MNNKVKDLLKTMNNDYNKFFHLPPFILWYFIKYPIIALFGVDLLIEEWENEKLGVKPFIALFFFIVIIIARSLDLVRLIILFFGGILSLIYLPIVEQVTNSFYMNKEKHNN